MELLVCVVDRERHLSRILSGFVELGIRGATVINSEGMAHHVGDALPVMAGLQSLLIKTRPTSATVFSVIDDAALVEAAIRMISEICGGIEEPGTGIVFTVPVSRAVGMVEPTGGAD
jgi:nitrogen regulatory protein P-II 1